VHLAAAAIRNRTGLVGAALPVVRASVHLGIPDMENDRMVQLLRCDRCRREVWGD
jgi:hypothetical protein